MADPRKDTPIDVAGMIENAFMMGLGVLEMTREKVTEVSDELISRGKMSQSDAKKVAERITEVASQQQEVLRKTVSEETSRAMDGAGLATHDEIASLRAEVAELKAMLAAQAGTTPVTTATVKVRRKPAAKKSE